jgi:hypothetical protein
LRQGSDAAQLQPLLAALDQPMSELLAALHAQLAPEPARA